MFCSDASSATEDEKSNAEKAARSMRFMSRLLQLIPVKEGEEIELVTDCIGGRGDGVARIGGTLRLRRELDRRVEEI